MANRGLRLYLTSDSSGEDLGDSTRPPRGSRGGDGGEREGSGGGRDATKGKSLKWMRVPLGIYTAEGESMQCEGVPGEGGRTGL